MKENIGKKDRGVRFVAGVLLLGAGLFLFSNRAVQAVSVLLGAIALVEAIIARCYLYRLLGINTCQKDKTRLWNVVAWLFVLCGLAAYSIGWTALLNSTTYWVPTEYWFYDALAAGVFALFFLFYAHQSKGDVKAKGSR